MRENHASCVEFTRLQKTLGEEPQIFCEICRSRRLARDMRTKLVGQKQSDESCEVCMNEHDESTPPPIISAVSNSASLQPPPSKPFSWWLRRLFACNPFYLASAALLLFGCYRI